MEVVAGDPLLMATRPAHQTALYAAPHTDCAVAGRPDLSCFVKDLVAFGSGNHLNHGLARRARSFSGFSKKRGIGV